MKVEVHSAMETWDEWLLGPKFVLTRDTTFNGRRLEFGKLIASEFRKSRLDMFRSQGVSEGRQWPDYQRDERPWQNFKSRVYGRPVGRGTGDINRWRPGRERLFPSLVTQRHPEHIQTIEPDRVIVGTRVPHADDISRGGRLPTHFGGGRRPARALLSVGRGTVNRLRRLSAAYVAEHEKGFEQAVQASRASILNFAKR